MLAGVDDTKFGFWGVGSQSNERAESAYRGRLWDGERESVTGNVLDEDLHGWFGFR